MRKIFYNAIVLVTMLMATSMSHAQDTGTTTETVMLLPTKSEGAWQCMYYFLNSNDELSKLKTSYWTGRCVDESEWTPGVGPFSNSNDQFLTTPWGSDRLPLLVRRHFTLTADEVAQFRNQPMQVLLSYDENPKVYLNGTLLFQKTGFNDNEYVSYTLTSRNKLMLREGNNVLAVSLMAGAGGGHVDYGLTVTRPLPTGISTVDNLTNSQSDNVVYDLQGRKVADLSSHPSKGIYISNGKKFVVK